MRVCEEFSKYASSYAQYNVIQTRVAEKLLASSQKPHRILDLGCGSGTLYKLIDFPIESFVGVDFSATMLEHHPKDDGVELICGDFNDEKLFEQLQSYSFDRLYSSSALQWAADMDRVAGLLAQMGVPISLGIFTAGTFKTLYETASLQPILKTPEETRSVFEPHFPDADFELVRYSLEFDNVREMFRYIKRSGVSGGRRVLDYRQTRALLERYPLNALEFEVLFITTR